MEGTARTAVAAAIAPIVWGSGYYVTQAYLPPDRPLFGAAVRALPFGLILLALRPRALSGVWWWRTAALGVLNFSAFFVLIFVAAYRLPSGVAATLTATSPLAVMLLAWMLIGERPRAASIAAAIVGIAGVAVLVLRGGVLLDPLGVMASLAAVGCSSLGFVLVKAWRPPVDLLPFTAWQLIFGGIVLVPVALVVEGPPPPLDLPALGGFAYLGIVGTVLAYVVWFRGLQTASAAAISLIGLLNPVAGAVVGATLGHETFTALQLLGMVLVLCGVFFGQPAVADRLIRRRHVALLRPRSAER